MQLNESYILFGYWSSEVGSILFWCGNYFDLKRERMWLIIVIQDVMEIDTNDQKLKLYTHACIVNVDLICFTTQYPTIEVTTSLFSQRRASIHFHLFYLIVSVQETGYSFKTWRGQGDTFKTSVIKFHSSL